MADAPVTLETRLAQVEANLNAKIQILETKVDSVQSETRTGFEYLGKILDERFKSSDQRADMATRELRQSIEFLTDQHRQVQSGLAAMEVRLTAAEKLQSIGIEQVKDVSGRQEKMSGNLTWLARVVISGPVVALIVWYLTQRPPV